MAPLFAEAVKRIHFGESVSSLFSDEETYRLGLHDASSRGWRDSADGLPSVLGVGAGG